MLVDNIAERKRCVFSDISDGECFLLDNYLFMKVWNAEPNTIVRICDGFICKIPKELLNTELEVISVLAVVK